MAYLEPTGSFIEEALHLLYSTGFRFVGCLHLPLSYGYGSFADFVAVPNENSWSDFILEGAHSTKHFKLRHQRFIQQSLLDKPLAGYEYYLQVL